MNRDNYHTQYSAEEILQYLSGKMDREQTRMLERAVLDDDFLAKAIEGYRLMRETMSDDTILGKLVAPVINTTEKKQAAVISTKPLIKWIGYVAAASLVVGGGWWILNTSQPNQTTLPVPSFQQNSVSEMVEAAGEHPAISPADIVKTKPLPPPPIVSTTPEKSTIDNQNNVARKASDAKKTDQMQAIAQHEAELNDAVVKSKMEQSDAQSQRKARALVAPQPSQNMDNPSMTMASETVSSKNAMARKIPVVIVPVDTLNGTPVEGWADFKDKIKKDLATNPIPPGIVTITIYPNGSIGEIILKGKFSAAETEQIERWFRKGAGWKSNTQTTTSAIISWH